MRPLLALVLSLAILGAVQAYMLFVDGLPKYVPSVPVEIAASGHFRLELTLSQDAQPDAFEATSLLVNLPQQDNRVLVHKEEVISALEPIVIDSITEFVEGDNELFIQVGVGDAGFDLGGSKKLQLRRAAVRVQLFRDRLLLADQTLWAEPGEPIQGKLVIAVPALKSPEEAGDHEH